MSSISLKITKLFWGKIEIDGNQVFKDVKLFPGGCRKWNWRETGTEHFPGIQYSDVQELLDNGANTVILSRGVLGRLKVSKVLIDKLVSDGITVHILKTNKAVKLHNELLKTEKVGALIHTTC